MMGMVTLQRLNVVRIVATEDEAKALIAEGFVQVEDAPEQEGKAVDEMTVAELEAYAASKGIDLTDCKTKPEKLEKIKQAEGGE